MLSTHQKAIVSISIDLPADVSGALHAPAVSIGHQLVELFQHCAFPATWALPDPANSPLAERLAGDPLAHEIALLGEADWIGAGAGRTQFSQQLTRRMESAAAAGFRIHALALHGTDLTDDLDLLVKHRIALVRSDTVIRRGSAAALRPQSVRYGVWRAPVAGILGGNSSWWPASPMWAARRAVRRAIADAGFVHFVIDAAHMAGRTPAQLSGIRKLLRAIRQHELRGVLNVAPLTQASARWIRPRVATQSRSILRHVA